jgi:hypothetical protein
MKNIFKLFLFFFVINSKYVYNHEIDPNIILPTVFISAFLVYAFKSELLSIGIMTKLFFIKASDIKSFIKTSNSSSIKTSNSSSNESQLIIVKNFNDYCNNSFDSVNNDKYENETNDAPQLFNSFCNQSESD